MGVGLRAGAFEIGQLCSMSGHTGSDTAFAAIAAEQRCSVSGCNSIGSIPITRRHQHRDILHMTLVLNYSALSRGARAECRFFGVLSKRFGSFTHHSIGDIGFKIPDEFPNHRHLIVRTDLSRYSIEW